MENMLGFPKVDKDYIETLSVVTSLSSGILLQLYSQAWNRKPEVEYNQMFCNIIKNNQWFRSILLDWVTFHISLD